ncbi:MAG: hypothetical protein KatS3mg081_1657 [Gemmatimonadales bacterium]|nr:MAG: hypothetical protein KatS3mg081_1657 [Gemmatimonadales bacterium]
MRRFLIACAACLGAACGGERVDIGSRLAQYAVVPLEVNLDSLSPRDRQLLAALVSAAAQMDTLFWHQAYGNYQALLASIRDPDLRRYVEINYGPWDRLAGDEPFIEGVGPKPPGANFYPPDLTKEEFESYLQEHPEQADSLKSLYTLVRRRSGGGLEAIPYHRAYQERLLLAAADLRMAAALAREPGLKRYLELRAEALRTDDYKASDLAWLDMKDNSVDLIIGPIETYEDQLFGYKAAYEAYVLVKDRTWTQRLERYTALLPGLQRELPVAPQYKRERPGLESELGVYDAVFYAGHANAGPKAIAVNLPNDEEIQLTKGTRRLQIRNAMRAKFENILLPIADLLIAGDQRRHVTFDAFFTNTMFHEVAHGLGIKQTINGRGTVREALKEHASAVEEGKADVLGLFLVERLKAQGEMVEGELMDNYVTALASILRSVRFGASSAHGRANMVRFNFFMERGAFARDSATGTYRVNPDRMSDAIRALSERLLVIQGDGNYEAAAKMLAEEGAIGPELQADLDRLSGAGIPVDVVFEQGRGLLRPQVREEFRSR